MGGPEKRATAMSLPTALSFEAQKTAQEGENGCGGARGVGGREARRGGVDPCNA